MASDGGTKIDISARINKKMISTFLLAISVIVFIESSHSYIIIKTSNPIVNATMYAAYPNLLELDMSNLTSFAFPENKVLLAHTTLSSYVCNHCSIHSIYQLSLSKLPNLTSLKLQYNNLKFVHPDAFAHNTRLEKLYLTGNELTTFNPDATLRHISPLAIMDLSDNFRLDLNKVKLVSDMLMILKCNNCGTKLLKRNTLVGLRRIAEINLTNNSLEHIDSDAFESLSYIKSLNVDDNPDLRRLIFTSKTLRYLSAQNCSLDGTLQAHDLPALKSINVRKNQIKHLNELDFAEKPQLQAMLLDDNEIKKVPSLLIKLSQLQRLCVDRNLLQPYENVQQAAEMYRTRNLRYDCLEDNDTTHQFEYHLPSYNGIAVYRKQPEHYLSRDGSTIDLSSKNIVFIEKEYLANNPIAKIFLFDNNHKFKFSETVPFLESESLEILSMQNCSITAIFKCTFEKLPNIKSISLQNNKIQTLYSQSIFANIPKLNYMNLARNNLELISTTVFQRLNELEVLILDGNNNLTNVEEGFLVSTSLRNLSCVNCGFTRIDNHVLTFLPKLQSLNLQNNPLKSCVLLFNTLNSLKTLCLEDKSLDGATLQAFEDHINIVTELETNCEEKKLSIRVRRNYNTKTTAVTLDAEQMTMGPMIRSMSLITKSDSSSVTSSTLILIGATLVLILNFLPWVDYSYLYCMGIV